MKEILNYHQTTGKRKKEKNPWNEIIDNPYNQSKVLKSKHQFSL